MSEEMENKGVIRKGEGSLSPSSSASPTPPSVSISSSDLSSLLSAASSLADRVQWASRMGLDSFGGQRDLYAALGYKRTLTLQDYRERYERGGIASRIVEFLPEITWSGEVAVQEVEDPATVTEFEEDVLSLLSQEDLNLQKTFQAADILCGLGYYSVILIGGPGELNTELPRLSGPDSLLYLQPYSQEQATITKLDENRQSRRFGLAEAYKVDLGSVPSGITSTSLTSSYLGQKDVHWSRIIHVTKKSLFNRLYGRPVLQPVWNDLDNLYKLIGGGSETAWNIMSLPTLFSIDKDVVFPSEQMMEAQLKEFKESIERLRHKLEPYAYGRGVTADVIGNKGGLPQFGPDADAVMDQIAGTLGYPKRVLIGNEAGYRASEQDVNMINNRKDEHIRDCAEPTLRQFLNRMIKYGGVRSPAAAKGNRKGKGISISKPYKIIWAKEEELTEEKKASVVNVLATANKNQVEADGTLILSSNEIRDQIYGKKPLEVKVKIEEEEETSAPEPEPVTPSPSNDDDIDIDNVELM